VHWECGCGAGSWVCGRVPLRGHGEDDVCRADTSQVHSKCQSSSRGTTLTGDTGVLSPSTELNTGPGMRNSALHPRPTGPGSPAAQTPPCKPTHSEPEEWGFGLMYLGQAVDEWGTVAKGINNGKSYIRFSKVQFFRPEAVAAEYSSTDGDTGLVQAVVFDVSPHPRPALPFHSILSSRRCSHVHRSFPLERRRSSRRRRRDPPSAPSSFRSTGPSGGHGSAAGGCSVGSLAVQSTVEQCSGRNGAALKGGLK